MHAKFAIREKQPMLIELQHLKSISSDQLKAFMDAVNANSALQEQLRSATDAQAVAAIAKVAGFEISAKDIPFNQQSSSLLDKEPEGVAGGGTSGADCGDTQGRGVFCSWMMPFANDN